MLPAQPIPASRRFPSRAGAWIGPKLGPLLWPWLLAGLLLLLALGGCQGVGQPSRGVLLEALEQQIALTQQAIAEALELGPPGPPEVSRVRVEQQETVAIGDSRGLHLSGRFDWRLADAPYRVDSNFDLYLVRGEGQQAWRLARPLPAAADGGAGWLIDPLPPQSRAS